MDSRSTTELDLSKVRLIDYSNATQFYWAYVEPLPIDKVSLKLGREQPSRPVKLIVEKGGKPGDFLWNGIQLVVASEKVLRIFEENGFKGYSTFPVEVQLNDQHLDGYTGIAVTGRAGPMDQEKSHARRFEYENGRLGGFRATDGLYFDPKNWDGSDIFCVDEVPGAMLVVERVWKALEKAKVSAYRARLLSEFRFGVPLGKKTG